MAEDPWAEFSPQSAKEKDPWAEFSPESATRGAEIAQEPQGVNWKDIGKSAVSGVGSGVTGLAGLPGDIAHYGAQGLGWLTGTDPESWRDKEAKLPTSGEVQKATEKYTGEFYKPQTTAGKYAHTVGEFAPAVIGGPEGIIARFAKRALIPGVAAETAGQATEKVAPEYADLARTGAGLAAGLGAMRSGKYAVPTLQDLEKHGGALYKHPDIADVRIASGAVHKELGDIKQSLEDMIDPDLMPGTWSRVGKEQAQHAPSGGGEMAALTGVKPTPKPDVSIDDLDTLRKQLRTVARDYSPSRRGEDRMAANIAIGKIDEFLSDKAKLSGAVTAGDIDKAIPLLNEARDTWAAARRVETADKKLASALLRAGSTYSGENVENTIRQNLRRIIDPDSAQGKRLRMGWSQLELDRAKDIVEHGAPMNNVLRFIGNKLGGNLGWWGGAAAALETGRPELLALGAVGKTIKGIANQRVLNRANALKETLASRSPLAEQWKAAGKMVPLSPLGPAAGIASYLLPIRGSQGFKKGGRVVKSFLYKP